MNQSDGGHSLRAGMELLGDQWTLLIVQSVFLRVRRYEELRQRLGISPGALSGRLAAAVDAGVLHRRPYADGGRTRKEYRLTARGMALWTLLVSIWAWERAWVPSRARTLPDLVHHGCGSATSPVLGCAACGEPVPTGAVRAEGTLRGAGGGSRRFRRRNSGPPPSDPLMFFPETMRLLGDRWCAGIMLAGFLGARHFSDFQRELDIGPSVLSERLHDLVDAGVLAPGAARTRADAMSYRLTAKGTDFLPTLALIVDWADPRGGEVRFRHQGCGAALVPELRCARCTGVLERRAVRFTTDVRDQELLGVTRS